MHLTLLILAVIIATTYGYKSNDDKNPDTAILTEEIEDEIDQILSAETEDEQDEFYSDAKKILKTKSGPFIWTRRRRSARRRSCVGPSRSTCNIGLKYDGCDTTTLIVKDIPEKETLSYACIKHDVCYNCGQAKGWSQSDCDKTFQEDAKKACACTFASNVGTNIAFCYAIANAMYEAMQKGDYDEWYLTNSHGYCNNTCVDQFSYKMNIFK